MSNFQHDQINQIFYFSSFMRESSHIWSVLINWRRLSKLLSNIGCLFTCCYFNRANSIKTNLQTCNLQTMQSINTSSLTDSYIIFTLEMESASKNTIFGLKMMVKSGLEKFILKSLHAGRCLFLLLNLWFWALLWSKGK